MFPFTEIINVVYGIVIVIVAIILSLSCIVLMVSLQFDIREIYKSLITKK